MKLVALATLAFGSSLVLAAPINFDMQDLAVRRETYEVGDFAARDFAHVDEFDAREYSDDEGLKVREDELEDVFERGFLIYHLPSIGLPSHPFGHWFRWGKKEEKRKNKEEEGIGAFILANE